MNDYKINNLQLDTPILFITYRRPKTTQKVFETIRNIRPKKLYIAHNFYYSKQETEIQKWRDVRKIIDNINWDCEVKRLYREEHLNAKISISTAINWFFENEEQGIILEDDCLPHETFYRYCEELLVHYKNDLRIGMISGNNFQFGTTINEDSYYFSRISHDWGWATWRNRWFPDYDVQMKNWPTIRNEGRVADWFTKESHKKYWTKKYDQVYQNMIDTWDYQWGFTNQLNGRLVILPNKNLVSNIGFGVDATNTFSEGNTSNLPVASMKFPLKHPIAIFPSNKLDSLYLDRTINSTIFKRIKNKIKVIFK
jgi:hypothetical protein